jgi:hypothetical protein
LSTNPTIANTSPPFVDNVPQFNPANGTLTSVQVTLTGQLIVGGEFEGDADDGDALLNVQVDAHNGLGGAGPSFSAIPTPQNLHISDTGNSSLLLATWTGTSIKDITLTFAAPDDTDNDMTFAGVAGTGNNILNGSLIFTFTPTATTPLPATLPLLATGIGGLGLLGWRRKRKAQAVA